MLPLEKVLVMDPKDEEDRIFQCFTVIYGNVFCIYMYGGGFKWFLGLKGVWEANQNIILKRSAKLIP